MNHLERREAIRNFFDLGYVRQTLKNAMKEQMEMGIKEFLKYLFFGAGYTHWTPPQLERQLKKHPDMPVIDLRPPARFKNGHIKGAQSHPFDDFLQVIVMDKSGKPSKNRQVVLICDTGHKSRVAASILAESGFQHPISLHRGMHRFKRWQRLKSSQKGSRTHCCNLLG